MSFAPWSLDTASAVLATTCDKPGPVLISLQAIQERFGYVPEQAVELVAKGCNVSRADVHGVLTFYHDLRTTMPSTTTLRICVAEACQAVGSRDLVSEVEKLSTPVWANQTKKWNLSPSTVWATVHSAPRRR